MHLRVQWHNGFGCCAHRVWLRGQGVAGTAHPAPGQQLLEIAVVGSRNPAKVHADLPAAHVIADPEEAATSAKVDLVVIASPNETHVPLATAALNSGKDVVIDKPFTVTLAEARKLTELALKQKRLLSVFRKQLAVV